MSTLSALKTAVKAFVYNNSNYSDVLPGETSAVNLEAKIDAAILVAVNNAKLFAEKQHDFAYTEVSVPVTLTSAGASIFALGSGPTKMKKVTGVKLVCSDGGTKPMLFTKGKDLDIRQRISDRLGVEDRYPSYSPGAISHEPQITLRGLTLNSFPLLSSGESMSIMVDGYKWTDRYTALDNTTDWLIQCGFDFLMWQTIIELNYIVNIFVPRQEGSLSPPEKLRDEAFASLLIVDSDLDTFYGE